MSTSVYSCHKENSFTSPMWIEQVASTGKCFTALEWVLRITEQGSGKLFTLSHHCLSQGH
jgi:hypothetical protein